MKTKHNVFVPVGSQQEAEMQHSVLKAMKQPIYSGKGFDNPNYLYFWSECNEWYFMEGNVPKNLTQITFGELIDILSKPEKIAVKLENEREFKALMKYYDGLGFEPYSDIVIEGFKNGEAVDYHNYYRNTTIEIQEIDGYKIIPFQYFAKEHNIKVPVLISQDGKELFEGDGYHSVYFNSKQAIWVYNMFWSKLEIDDCVITNPDIFKAFSTKESALKWIEEQKPKSVEYVSDFGIKCQISKEESLLNCGCGCFSLTNKDIQAISKAMEDLQ